MTSDSVVRTTDTLDKVWTGHVYTKDFPWVEIGVPGMEIRVLHYREDEEMSATELRAAPYTVAGRHLHLGSTSVFTYAGCWGHDKTYSYIPGTYNFEPINALHQFFSGPDPVGYYSVSYGDLRWVDEETGEIAGSVGVRERVANYFQQCEEQGFPRPNVLRL